MHNYKHEYKFLPDMNYADTCKYLNKCLVTRYLNGYMHPLGHQHWWSRVTFAQSTYLKCNDDQIVQ